MDIKAILNKLTEDERMALSMHLGNINAELTEAVKNLAGMAMDIEQSVSLLLILAETDKSPAVLKKHIASVADKINAEIQKRKVDIFESAPGTQVSSDVHEVVGEAINPAAQEAAGDVSESVFPGVKYKGTIVIKEQVMKNKAPDA